MAKAELKTKKNKLSVSAFLNGIEDAKRKQDAKAIHKLMREVTGSRAAMWGDSIVGYGKCHMVYESGRELDWMHVGFSPRKAQLVLYIMDGFSGHKGLMKKLGKFKTGKSCLYVKKLEDVDLTVLRDLVEKSVAHMKKKYPS
jgi:hypothetical protein